MNLLKIKKKCFAIVFIAIFSASININALLLPKPNFAIISRIVTAVLSSEHYKSVKNKEELSKQLFNEYLEALDPNHLYFTQKDIENFKKQTGYLYDSLTQGNTSFAFIAYNTLINKVNKRENYAKILIEEGFDFSKNEFYKPDRSKEDWAKSEKELDDIWREKIKNDILTFRLMNKITEEEDKDNGKKPQLFKKTPEERTLNRLKAYRIYLEENDPIDVLELYLSTLAHIYDPHSSYMSPQSEENFNIQMQLSFVGIGAMLSSEDGYTKVEKLIPGGPAAKSGNLKPSDRIIAVGEDNSPPVDIIDMPLTKVVKKIRGKKGTNVHLIILEGIQGKQAIPKEIVIKRGIVKLKDSEASSEIKTVTTADGKKLRIGIITLPSFYYDFRAALRGEKNFKSSTRDIKKILKKFSKEKIDGAILDLRANSGGSLKEAISITGLFIKSGPIVQTRNQRNYIYVEDDPDETCYYNGPLLVLVSRLSASAAEILAGAIQDYGRGIIVGDQRTHGKGTVQTVLDLGEILTRFHLGFNPGAIKLTSAQFYRITGSSTQEKGVIPDITFPSFMDHMDIGEDKLKHALPWNSIKPTSFTKYTKLTKFIPKLKSDSQTRMAKNPNFIQLRKTINLFERIKDKKEISLNEKTRWDNYLQEKKVLDEQKSIFSDIANKNLTKDDTKKDDEEKDLYLDESINILTDYINMLKECPDSKMANHLTSQNTPETTKP